MIKCCKGCVPPKRQPGCHDRCPEYQKEHREDMELKREIHRQEAMRYALDGARIRAMRRIRKEGRKTR